MTQENQAPLEDLMATMDVVDTLRHQKHLVDRELDDENRRQRMLDKLREFYAAQGIDVPDHVLQEGIAALEEERFKYQSAPSSFSTKLAHWYVSRKRWGKKFRFAALAAGLFGSVHLFTNILPERQARESLPTQIKTQLEEIKAEAKNPQIISLATEQASSAQTAIKDEKYQTAENIRTELGQVLTKLRNSYEIKIVSRPNEQSGIWRVPDVNQSSKNYYLIVEAIDKNQRVVKLPIVSEESGKRVTVGKWGLRVNEKTFVAVATDKKDDGIIQANKVGEKKRGYLLPTFSIPTTGATITKW